MVGAVAAADGGLGVLVHENSELTVRGIPHAGKYEGKLDLSPADDKKGAAKVTVNVADWWPYAFATIALGVIVGHWITQYYKQQRGASEQKVRAAQLWQQVTDAESRFQKRYFGRPMTGYSMAVLAQKWIQRTDADKKVPAPKADDAKGHLDKLEKYTDDFAYFRQKLGVLQERQDQVRGQVQQRAFGLGRQDIEEDMEAFQKADSVLKGRSFDFPPEGDENEDGAALKECSQRAEAAARWLDELGKTHLLIDRYLAHAEAIDTTGPGWTEKLKEELQGQKKALEKLGRKALQAGKQDDVAAQNDSADTANAEVLRLEKEAAGVEALAKGPRPFSPPYAQAPTVSVSPITCTVLAPEPTSTSCQGDSDDLFGFSATITFPSPLASEYKAQWDFGDGSASEPWSIPPGTTIPMPLKTSHRFAESDTYIVALKNGAGETLQTCQATVNMLPGRWTRLLQGFRLTDTQMTFVAGVLAVASGLLALYCTNASWGSPADYLKALLWGSAASEGLKYVSNLVGRMWPPA